jgi:hypothetical protein
MSPFAITHTAEILLLQFNQTDIQELTPINVCWFRLDEKSIMFGRTGIRQDGDGTQANLRPEIVAFTRDSRSNSQEGGGGSSSSNTLQIDPTGKPCSALSKLQGGEALRCLSPAEEVGFGTLHS